MRIGNNLGSLFNECVLLSEGFNPCHIFRQKLDQLFAKTILPRIDVQMRSSVELSREFQDDFPESYAYLEKERVASLPQEYGSFPEKMNYFDKINLIRMGFIFDSMGEPTQIPPGYTVDKSSGYSENVVAKTIYEGDGRRIAEVTTGTFPQPFCRVHWWIE